MNYNKIFKELRTAHKGQSSAMIRYVVYDNSELGYALQTEFLDFRDVDRCMLNIHIVVHRPDFAHFTGTEDGVKWMFENVMKKIMKLNKKARCYDNR